MTTKKHNSGFTLIEVMIVTGISAILMCVVAMLIRSTNDSYTFVADDSDANYGLRRALNRISDDLRQSDSSVVVITVGADYYTLDLQVPLSYAGSTISWGAAGNAGWHVKYLVDTNYGWLVRRVTDATGTPKVVDEVMAHNVDTAAGGGGVPGFSVTANNGLYTLSLRVWGQRAGTFWRRTETTSASTRN